MSKSKKFFCAQESHQSTTIRRTTSDSNHSISRLPSKPEIDSNQFEHKDDLQQHPPLMRKKSHFFQIHHRDAIATTPTIEFSPSDDDYDYGDSGRLNTGRGGGQRCVSGEEPAVIEEQIDENSNAENVLTNPRPVQGNTTQTSVEVNATSETSLISKRELRKRLARLLLRSCDIYDADNNLPGDQSKKFALR